MAGDQLCGATASLTLQADPWHPFFFDHQLDHVPGIWVVTSLLDLLNDTAGPRRADGRLRLSLTFPHFCELDRKVELHCASANPADGQWRLWAGQDGVPICDGTATLLEAAAATDAGTSAVPDDLFRPAAGELVHRVDPGNIMVGELVQRGPDVFEAAVLSSPAFPGANGPRRPVEIIESARQLSLMLGHVAYARKFDAQTVWLAVEADVPVTLSRTSPLALRWRSVPAGRSAVRFEFDLVGGVGSVTIVSQAVSRVAYERLRAARSAA